MADRASTPREEPAYPAAELDEREILIVLRRLSALFRSAATPEAMGRQVLEQLSLLFHLDQAILYPYEAGDVVLSSLAEHLAPGRHPVFSSSLNIRPQPILQQVLAELKCHTLDKPSAVLASAMESAITDASTPTPPDDRSASVSLEPSPWSVLAVPVSHLGHAYGLMLLVRRSLAGDVPWSEQEQSLAQEVAGQLGMAIAHLSLQAQNQALTQKLNHVRDGFIQKHQQLEEARAQSQRAYEQAEEASRLKSEFLANTSHELRTPLNGMIGFLKLVLDGMADTPEELNEFVAEAHSSALLLLDIINDILDIAKIEAGKMDLDLTAVQLSELFDEVDRKTRFQATSRGLIYEIDPPPTHDDVVVYGDYQRILQVMLNLIGNAIKFTKYGSVTISTRIIKKPVTINQQELPGFVEIRVVDTGIGVSLEQQAKLFKSFSQVDGSRTRQYGGTGLGLVISQKLVEAMGGEVHFYSMGEDLGSTVTFTIPLYQKPVMIAVPEDL